MVGGQAGDRRGAGRGRLHLRVHPPVHRGEPFSEANIAADRDTILSYYYNNGYPDATFDWTQTPGPLPTQWI